MKTVLCFGDSNTWGYDAETYDIKTGCVNRIPFEERWPGIAQQKLGSGFRILENALNARTIIVEDPYYVHRRGIDSLEEAMDMCTPLDLVAIQLGVNELKQMFCLDAGVIADGMGKLVQAAQKKCYGYAAPKVLIIAPAPVLPTIEQAAFGYRFGPLAYQKSLALGARYRAIAERYGCGFLDCANLKLELNKIDGIHYCREDHAKLGAAAAEIIAAMLQ